ncbi:uncharacterized protein LOC111710968 isoform X2 [Eurytemora carolleeae]|uniref:uncharacterized protein LOC111710968 isoform X2 n=1 Tax=Eurytemora carolleeae TaxID=1294199 RepID=UPI000C76EEAD|nr:uncharacterized protein LOC111710968 isoform X2 [Eurytemora carolleeae]|eukprot:XP_023340944.1 uncharacterized protein LOC111710968 isoform X2 [Eurytemora affinis]
MDSTFTFGRGRLMKKVLEQNEDCVVELSKIRGMIKNGNSFPDSGFIAYHGSSPDTVKKWKNDLKENASEYRENDATNIWKELRRTEKLKKEKEREEEEKKKMEGRRDPYLPEYQRQTRRGSSRLLDTGRKDNSWLYQHLVQSSSGGSGVNRPDGRKIRPASSNDVSHLDQFQSAEDSISENSVPYTGRKLLISRLGLGKKQDGKPRERHNPLISLSDSEISVCDLAAVDSDFTSDGDLTQYYSAQSSLDSQMEF